LDGLKPFLDYVQNNFFKASLSRKVLKYHVDQSFELYYTNYILGRLKPFSLLPFSFPVISQVADELEEPCGLGGSKAGGLAGMARELGTFVVTKMYTHIILVCLALNSHYWLKCSNIVIELKFSFLGQ
jgi:hypothetical protein